ncbi:hypothetical protein LCGC14_2366330 [marine sediment metagenome]|uniref:Uncharacterized protein n=1 Tax=marine sediment metagenome TaxID=412755 RepID=A0A0F9EHL2_9ZZZZ
MVKISPPGQGRQKGGYDMELRTATHKETGKPMVEVWQDGVYMASIYVHEDGFRIVSEHLDGIEHGATSPPSVVIRFSK